MKNGDRFFVSNKVGLRDIIHPEKYRISRAGMTSLDQEYCEKLRTSFDHVRICRDKVSYYHPIMPIVEEQTQVNLPSDNSEASNGVVSALSKFSFTLGRHHRPVSPRHLDKKEHRSASQTSQNLDSQPNNLSIEKQNTHVREILSVFRNSMADFFFSCRKLFHQDCRNLNVIGIRNDAK